MSKKRKTEDISEYDFMVKKWTEWEQMGPVCCVECDIELQFAPIHVLHISKGSNPGLRLHPKNVMPGCPTCHQWFDHGLEFVENGIKVMKTRKDMTIWPYVEKRIIELKREYADTNIP